MKEDLKPEHRLFAEQYVIDWNGTRAYQVAYPKVDTKSAEASASRLLRNVKVKEYIEAIQEDISKLAGVSALSNLLELKKIIQDEKEQTTNRIKAIDIINKMLGSNAPSEIDVKSNGESINFIIGFEPDNPHT